MNEPAHQQESLLRKENSFRKRRWVGSTVALLALLALMVAIVVTLSRQNNGRPYVAKVPGAAPITAQEVNAAAVRLPTLSKVSGYSQRMLKESALAVLLQAAWLESYCQRHHIQPRTSKSRTLFSDLLAQLIPRVKRAAGCETAIREVVAPREAANAVKAIAAPNGGQPEGLLFGKRSDAVAALRLFRRGFRVPLAHPKARKHVDGESGIRDLQLTASDLNAARSAGRPSGPYKTRDGWAVLYFPPAPKLDNRIYKRSLQQSTQDILVRKLAQAREEGARLTDCGESMLRAFCHKLKAQPR